MQLLRGMIVRRLLRSGSLRSVKPVTSCTPLHTKAVSAALHARQSRHSPSCNPFRPNAAASVDVEPLDAQSAGYSTFTLDSQMTWPSRTHGAGSLTANDAGKDITVCGWVDRNRNLGGLGFMDVRDHTGLLQVGVWHRRLPGIVGLLEKQMRPSPTEPCKEVALGTIKSFDYHPSNSSSHHSQFAMHRSTTSFHLSALTFELTSCQVQHLQL